MRLVVQVDQGILEVNYMWLPSWVGMNSILLKELGEHLQGKSVGKELTDGLLDELSREARRFLCDRFPLIKGLNEYLSALEHVSIDGNEQAER